LPPRTTNSHACAMSLPSLQGKGGGDPPLAPCCVVWPPTHEDARLPFCCCGAWASFVFVRVFVRVCGCVYVCVRVCGCVYVCTHPSVPSPCAYPPLLPPVQTMESPTRGMDAMHVGSDVLNTPSVTADPEDVRLPGGSGKRCVGHEGENPASLSPPPTPIPAWHLVQRAQTAPLRTKWDVVSARVSTLPGCSSYFSSQPFVLLLALCFVRVEYGGLRTGLSSANIASPVSATSIAGDSRMYGHAHPAC
jgi:hypothetical protein